MGAIEEYKARRAAHEARQAKQQKPPEKRTWWFRERLPIDRFTGWLMAYTGLLFVATVINAAVLYKTDITLRETMIAAQRPWVTVQTSISGPFKYDDTGASVSLTIKMKNTGQTPAISLTPSMVMFVDLPGAVGPLHAIEILNEACRRSGGLAVGYGQGGLLFPNEEFSLTHSVHINRDRVEKQRGLPSFLWPSVVSCARYKFSFNDEIRRTAVLYQLLRPNLAEPRSGMALDIDGGPIHVDGLRLFTIGSDAN